MKTNRKKAEGRVSQGKRKDGVNKEQKSTAKPGSRSPDRKRKESQRIYQKRSMKDITQKIVAAGTQKKQLDKDKRTPAKNRQILDA